MISSFKSHNLDGKNFEGWPPILGSPKNEGQSIGANINISSNAVNTKLLNSGRKALSGDPPTSVLDAKISLELSQ